MLKTRMIFLLSLSLASLSGCSDLTKQDTETKKAFCIVFGDKLPTRSSKDTEITRYEIQQLYAEYIDQCPEQAAEIPWLSQFVDTK